MNDEQILEMGGDEEDIRKCAEEHGATNPMPPNTKKCCSRCIGILGKKAGRCIHLDCPCHTPSLDKSEHDGTCRTPECYEKRPTPTPAVEDWEEKLKVMILSRGMGVSLNDCVNYVRSLLKSDRKRIVRCIWKLLEEKAYVEAVPDNVKDYGEPNKVIAVRHLVNFITNLK